MTTLDLNQQQIITLLKSEESKEFGRKSITVSELVNTSNCRHRNINTLIEKGLLNRRGCYISLTDKGRLSVK